MVWWKILPFLALLIGPILVTHWRCERFNRGRAGAQSGEGVFGFARFSQWMAVGLWVAWLGGVLLLDPWHGLATQLGWGTWGGILLHNGLAILPPALVAALCEVVAFPTVQRARGLDVPLREAGWDAFMSRLWITLPATLFWIGFQTLPNEGERFSSWVPTGFMFGAFGTLLFIQVFWMRRRIRATFVPHAVTVGTLRDRAFALADKAGVKLNQIYLFPMARWRLANAFASQEKNLLLTDWLLRHLSRREVDAVIAHELAHMKRGHVSKLGWVAAPLWAGPIIWIRLHPVFVDLTWVALWVLGTWHAATFLSGLMSRRYERQADCDSLALSEDPSGLMTALLRLNRLNDVPNEFSPVDEKFSTHPSTLRRLRAIVRAAGLPESQIQAAVEASLGPSGEGYDLPESIEAATQGHGPVFDTRRRHSIASRYLWSYVGTLGLLPPLIAWASASIAAQSLSAQWACYAVGALFYLGVIYVVTDGAGRRAQARLKALIADRLRPQLEEKGMRDTAVFVGFSPGREIRIFEGCYNWDLGFLEVAGGQLCYVGEQVRFELRRDQIRSITLSPGPPRWSAPRVLQVEWTESGQTESCSFSCAGESSFRRDSRACQQLARTLQNWWQVDPSDPAPAPAGAGVRASLHLGQVTGKALVSVQSWSQFVMGLVLVLFPVILLMSGLNLVQTSFASVGYSLLLPIAGHCFASIPDWRRARAP